MAAKRVSKPVKKPAGCSPPSTESWLGTAFGLLEQRHKRGAVGDCPLPDLYRHARLSAPTLSLGQFHDGLRELHQQEKIYLHPWTGPLYELPEPALALLVGHEVAYYASLRNQESEVRGHLTPAS